MAKETLAKDRVNFINYTTTTLDNGLKIIHHSHQQSALAGISLLISAGSKNDFPGKSGLAHLFEHLMYGGTELVKDYDHWLQRAGGDGNAFTSQDVTCYYATIPVQNLALYLRLEADRLQHLKLTTPRLRTECQVVIEEFNETVLDEPFGDALHAILGHMFPADHPYSSPTIGRNVASLKAIHKDDLERFYDDYYHVGNAFLAIVSPLADGQVFKMCEDIFGAIRPHPHRDTLPTPLSRVPLSATMVKKANAPQHEISLVFPMRGRLSKQYLHSGALDLLLAHGDSSYLYKTLVRDLRLALDVDVYSTGHYENGLFFVEVSLAQDISIIKAQESIIQVLQNYLSRGCRPEDLAKIFNNCECRNIYLEMDVIKTCNYLAYALWLGRPEIIQEELNMHRDLRADDLWASAHQLLDPQHCFTLIYD